MTIAEYKVTPDEEMVSVANREEEEVTTPRNQTSVGGRYQLGFVTYTVLNQHIYRALFHLMFIKDQESNAPNNALCWVICAA